MPTGLKCAPLHGQHATETIYRDTDVVPLMDNLFGGGATIEKLCERFLRMLHIAKQYNFKLNPHETKCCVSVVECGGYNVSSAGMKPVPRIKTKILCQIYRIDRWDDLDRLMRCWDS